MNYLTSRLCRSVLTAVMVIALVSALSGCGTSKTSVKTSSATSNATTVSASTLSDDATSSITGTSFTSGTQTTVVGATTAASNGATTSKGGNGTPNATVKVAYSLKNVQSLTNFTYTTQITKNGKTETPYRVSRTANRIKVEWLYDKTKDSDDNNDTVLGTVSYITAFTFADGKQYKQLKFYNEPDRPGADIGYRGKDLVSAYHLWEQHDVTALLSGSSVTSAGTTKVEGLDVTVYSVISGGKTHKIYYNTTYKTWLKYEILSGNTVVESYLAKGFKVSGVTELQADWPTKLPGHPEQSGYALINISAMAGLKD